MINNTPGNTDTVIYKPEAKGTSHIAALSAAPGPSAQGGAIPRGPLPAQPGGGAGPEDDLPPPPPVRPMNGGSADVSLNDSASTTQSNVTSECSEAECDREPLVKQQAANRGENKLKSQS